MLRRRLPASCASRCSARRWCTGSTFLSPTRFRAPSSARCFRRAARPRYSTSAPTPSASSTCPRCCRPTCTSFGRTSWWWSSTCRSGGHAGRRCGRRRRRRTKASPRSPGGGRSSRAARAGALCLACSTTRGRRGAGCGARRACPSIRTRASSLVDECAATGRADSRRKGARADTAHGPRGSLEYEQRRERELVAPLSAMAAFAAASSIELYFVTPYGPYFQLTEEELARMSVHHFIEDAALVYGDPRAALAAEVALLTRAVRRVAGRRIRARHRHARGVAALVASSFVALHRGRRASHARGQRRPRPDHRRAHPPGPGPPRARAGAEPLLFHTADFAAFFLAVAVLYGMLRGRGLHAALTRGVLLLLRLHPALLRRAAAGAHALGLRCSVSTPRASRRAGTPCSLSCLVNFGALAYFKYANFGLDTARRALELLGVRVELPRLDVLLPIGISFHVFQSFAYVMDVIHGRIAPCRSFVHFALYVSWFPQLVAGPIERPGRLIPQLATIEERKAGFASRAAPRRGAVRGGLDPQAGRRRAVVDVGLLLRRAAPPRRAPRRCSGSWRSALQIYGDFSGYSRMAQGISHAFGRRAHGELRPSLRGAELPGLLAALAHLAVQLVPRLRLHPARRQPPRPRAPAGERARHHAAERPLARRRLDVPRSGERCTAAW